MNMIILVTKNVTYANNLEPKMFTFMKMHAIPVAINVAQKEQQLTFIVMLATNRVTYAMN